MTEELFERNKINHPLKATSKINKCFYDKESTTKHWPSTPNATPQRKQNNPFL